ncbi:MAG: FkbM family methyltransferase [Planctomycetes bacterium]|nr:FkbM family methyltransferase [Planctomycetota bacterium]MCB9911255.1 FkbM family methyltransferase [Planctomycetota bacterium]HPF15539.1 FkbM family methyltransferase [Planctomycetota bacterium]HRV82630.1 FkbM family methyltransferase [Planctomycetota bacterium]
MVLSTLRSLFQRLKALREPPAKTLDEWEERHRQVVAETLDRIESWIPKSGVILDVGANVGLFTEELAKRRPGNTFQLFEPVAQYFARCEARLGGRNGIALWQLALSDQNERRPIYKAKHNPGANSVVPEIMFDRRENSMVQPNTIVEEESIECARFSDWGPAHGIEAVAFIKIDTEGFDYAVLRGLIEFLRGAPKLPPILTELLSADYHPFWAEQEQVLEELFALGYSRFPLQDLPKVGDVLLLPRELGESFILPEEGHG